MIKRIFSTILAFFISIFSILFGIGNNENNLVIELSSNASTGYSWVYEMSNSDVLTLVSEQYVNSSCDYPIAIVGAPGKQVFIFAAKNAGEVTLTFTYQRNWEDEEEFADKLIYTCSVYESGVITILDIQEITNDFA